MGRPDRGSSDRHGPLREFGVVALSLCGSFVGGVVVIGSLLGLILALLVIVTFPWGFWLPSVRWPWVDVLVLAGLAGGATGVVVGVLATLARWFGTDRPTP